MTYWFNLTKDQQKKLIRKWLNFRFRRRPTSGANRPRASSSSTHQKRAVSRRSGTGLRKGGRGIRCGRRRETFLHGVRARYHKSTGVFKHLSHSHVNLCCICSGEEELNKLQRMSCVLTVISLGCLQFYQNNSDILWISFQSLIISGTRIESHWTKSDSFLWN